MRNSRFPWMALAACLCLCAASARAADRQLEGKDEAQTKTFEADAHHAKKRAKELTDALKLRGKGPFLESVALEAAMKGDTKREKAAYEAMVDAEPKTDTGFFSIGNLLMTEGDYEGAVKMYTRALERRPDLASGTLRHRADAYLAMGRPEEALKDVERALELAPQSGGLYQLRTRILIVLGDYRGAEKSYQASWKYGPHRKEADDEFICRRLKENGLSPDPCGP